MKSSSSWTQHLFALAVIFCSVPAGAADWSLVYDQARPSIPVIRQAGGICSGALISKNEILTAHHCVQQLRPITIQWFEKGKMTHQQKASVSRWLPRHDLAVLKLDGETALPNLKLSVNSDLKVGSEHVTIGHPFGIEINFDDNLEMDLLFNYTRGMISKVNEEKNFLTDMSISPGNSGGPVLNEKGDIIGVVSAKVVRKGAGNIGMMIHPKRLQEVRDLAPQNLTWKDAESSVDWGIKETFVNLKIKNQKDLLIDSVGAFDYKLWYKDRILLGFDRSISPSEKNIEYRGYVLGFRNYFETKGFIPLYWGLALKHVSYHNYGRRNYWVTTLRAMGFELEAGVGTEHIQEGFLSIGLSF